jgi:hypothetical protein
MLKPFVAASLSMLKPLGIQIIAVEVGAEAKLTCQASGIPAPEFRWSRNGSQYSDGVNTTNEERQATVVATSTLMLSSVTEEHTGTITCVAFQKTSGITELVTSTANIIVLSE